MDERHADRMSRVILLGSPKTKRTAYLRKGAALAGVKLELADWKDFSTGFAEKNWLNEKIFLKIDPPRWESCFVEELNGLIGEYERNLEQIARLGGNGNISFLNDPEGIRALLDKRGCKKRLKEAGILVTEELKGEFSTGKELLEAMEEQKIFQVFIKPNYGSGAAGAAAFRYEPGKGRAALYTCMAKDDGTGRLVNTRRLRRFGDRKEALSMVERLLCLNPIVERWYAKAEHGGFSYDLRAVVQDKEIDFMLARLSSGPITNLQLNNHPLRAEELGLPSDVWEGVAQLCRQAAGCYPSLRSIGIDILLEKRSLRPRIIEMNGQGDLIYQDIYGDNRIYCRQAAMMKEWLQAQ